VADLAVLPGYAAVADRILFDAARQGRDAAGGLGAAFDWQVLEKSRSEAGRFMVRAAYTPTTSQRPFALRAPAASMSPRRRARAGVKDIEDDPRLHPRRARQPKNCKEMTAR